MPKSSVPARRASNHDIPAPTPETAADALNGASKRDRIVAAALRLFASETYQAVTMDRVADTAGVAKGTLYLYFASKEALYLGILSDGLESISRRYQATVDARANVAERLRHAIAVSIQFYDEHRDLLRLIATEEPRLAEERHRLIDDWRERGIVFFTTLIEEGIRAGVFAAADARIATLAILGGIRSVMLYYGASRSAGAMSAELADFFLQSLMLRGQPHAISQARRRVEHRQ
jgi:AcrR family transcriptional regulator